MMVREERQRSGMGVDRESERVLGWGRCGLSPYCCFLLLDLDLWVEWVVALFSFVVALRQ